MTLLTDADIDAMRAVLEESLPGTAVIQTLSGTSDGGGGGSIGWNAAGTVACRVAPTSAYGTEREIASRVAEDVNWIVTVPAETVVSTNDRVVIDGTTYNVVGMHAPRSYELSRRLECNQVT